MQFKKTQKNNSFIVASPVSILDNKVCVRIPYFEVANSVTIKCIAFSDLQ